VDVGGWPWASLRAWREKEGAERHAAASQEPAATSQAPASAQREGRHPRITSRVDLVAVTSQALVVTASQALAATRAPPPKHCYCREKRWKGEREREREEVKPLSPGPSVAVEA
jgi:hypothetical protein